MQHWGIARKQLAFQQQYLGHNLNTSLLGIFFFLRIFREMTPSLQSSPGNIIPKQSSSGFILYISVWFSCNPFSAKGISICHLLLPQMYQSKQFLTALILCAKYFYSFSNEIFNFKPCCTEESENFSTRIGFYPICFLRQPMKMCYIT